jgi:dTDP-4-dehydrorhamnose 3,5-epimerase
MLKDGPIKDLIIKPVKIFEDDRGILFETFRVDELNFNEAWDLQPKMSYNSFTKPGVSRGPHEHDWQTDIFVFAAPGSKFRFFAWDNRRYEPTFGNRQVIDVGGDNPSMVIVPRNVVHAYKNIGDIDGLVVNSPNRLYAGKDKKEKVDEIRHELDPNNKFVLDMQVHA